MNETPKTRLEFEEEHYRKELADLKPLERWEDLVPEKVMLEMFHWNAKNIGKYRFREHLPMPYVRIGLHNYYILPQVIDWINKVQIETLPHEKAIRAVARQIAKRA